ncbi:MAG: YqgE/AlgH family protein [Planctomycetia bacterium]|nr:YqgE/AlgH family protein [Planctomycetia bacterium]
MHVEKIKVSGHELETGSLLVASPSQREDLLAKSVIMVLCKSETEIWGLILNHPTQLGVVLTFFHPGGEGTEDLEGEEFDVDESAPPEPRERKVREITYEDIMPCETESMRRINVQLFLSGLEAGPLVLFSRQPEYADHILPDGTCMSMSDGLIKRTAFFLKEPYRLMTGHVFWKKRKLASELNKGLWYVLPPGQINILCDSEELWASALEAATDDHVLQVLDSLQFPNDPGDN